MALADKHTERSDSLRLPVTADGVGSFRVVVTAPDGGPTRPVDFSLRDLATGESTLHHAAFLGPGGSKL
jgi:hypothetical protein